MGRRSIRAKGTPLPTTIAVASRMQFARATILSYGSHFSGPGIPGFNEGSEHLHAVIFPSPGKVVDFGILTTSLPDSIRRFNFNLMLPGKM